LHFALNADGTVPLPALNCSITNKVKPEDDQAETNRKSGLAYAAAFSLFAAVVVGLAIGWLLDRWLGTRPWLLVAGIVLGAAAGFYEFIRSSSKLST
jgi:ATP synthase protein I